MLSLDRRPAWVHCKVGCRPLLVAGLAWLVLLVLTAAAGPTAGAERGAVAGAAPTAAADGDSLPLAIPHTAGRVRFFAPGAAPAHVPLGVVHGFRRQGQLTHSLFEEVALEAKQQGGDIVVGTVLGTDDPLQEGYAAWVLGIAARATPDGAGRDTLRACENCLVDWLFVAEPPALPDSALRGRLEAKAFATARLKLAKYGYYLAAGANADSVAAGLALQLRIARNAVTAKADQLSFAARLVWADTSDEFWHFTHALQLPHYRAIDLVGSDRQLTHNALCGVYSRLPSLYADADADGVVDGRDREPRTPPGFQVDFYGRTLDSDGDGVPNTLDQQPFTIARYRLMVGNDGVPIVSNDADFDGIADDADACDSTDVRHVVDASGCSRVVKEMVAVLVDRGVLQERGIQFATNEAVLLEASTACLDSLGSALSDLPELRFSIDGHCDDRGSDELNLALSKRRADAVLDYLLAHFPTLQRAQFRTVGYGKSRPLESGIDEWARQRNRRVEIWVQNPEDAVRYVEGTRYLLREEAIDGYQFDSARSGP